jgi:hypothetical protein
MAAGIHQRKRSSRFLLCSRDNLLHMQSSSSITVKWKKEVFENVPVDLSAPVAELKVQLFSLTGVAPDKQKLIIGGKNLKDEQTLDVSGAKHGSVVQMMGNAVGNWVKPDVQLTFVEVASMSSSSSLSFPIRLTGTPVTVSLALVADGKLQTPAQLRAQIKRLLELTKAEARFFAQRSPRWQHRRQQALPPLGSVFKEYVPWGRVLLIFPCVATACHRLVTAPADMLMSNMSWSWAEVVMERVTRGRVKKVQVRLQRRA